MKPPGGPSPQPIRVLLIEDSYADARLFEMTLERAERGRFACTRSDRLQGGRDLLRDCTFDLVVLDLSLPDSDGIPTLTAVREIAPASPIVVVSGCDDDALREQLVKAGAQGVLVKGAYSGEELARALHDAVGRVA